MCSVQKEARARKDQLGDEDTEEVGGLFQTARGWANHWEDLIEQLAQWFEQGGRQGWRSAWPDSACDFAVD